MGNQYRSTGFDLASFRAFKREHQDWTVDEHEGAVRHHRRRYNQLRHGSAIQKVRASVELELQHRHVQLVQLKQLSDGMGKRTGGWLEDDLGCCRHERVGMQRWSGPALVLLGRVAKVLGCRRAVAARRMALLAMDQGGGVTGKLWAADQRARHDRFLEVTWTAQQWEALERWARKRDLSVATVARELATVGLEREAKRLGIS